MADVKKHIYLRDTRDRLLDLLGLGETYPVRDLPVGERLKVPYGSGAKIPVPASQRDCVYSLWSRAHETPVTRASGGAAAPCAAHGTGGTILIESPGITESTGYRIRALRETTGRWDYLHEVPEITVGLDTRTLARVLTGAWLDERLDAHAASDARVVVALPRHAASMCCATGLSGSSRNHSSKISAALSTSPIAPCARPSSRRAFLCFGFSVSA